MNKQYVLGQFQYCYFFFLFGLEVVLKVWKYVDELGYLIVVVEYIVNLIKIFCYGLRYFFVFLVFYLSWLVDFYYFYIFLWVLIVKVICYCEGSGCCWKIVLVYFGEQVYIYDLNCLFFYRELDFYDVVLFKSFKIFLVSM